MLRTNVGKFLLIKNPTGNRRFIKAASTILQQKEEIINQSTTTSTTITTSSDDPQTSNDGKSNLLKQYRQKTIKTYYGRQKKPARPPLVKNFFMGKVDTELLTYPEVLPRDDIAELHKDIENAVQYFRENIDSPDIVAKKEIPQNVIGDMKELDMFGVDISHELGGRSYGSTQMCLTSEAEAQDINVALTLNSHRLAARIIAECGSESMKNNYLPRMAKGELIATIGFYESESPEQTIFKTRATPKDSGWSLKGEKSFVTNAENANLFVIFVQTIIEDKIGDKKDTVSVFLVEKNVNGLNVVGPDKTIGCEGVPQSMVVFDNVQISEENLIGTLGNGTEVAQKLLRHARLQSGVVSLILMKNILKQLTQFCISTTQLGHKLMDMDMLKDKLAKATCATYALESMIYLTAGIKDDYNNADTDMETAIIRVFAQKHLLKLASIALDFMGPRTMVGGQPTDLYVRDALQLYTHGEPVDSLILFIGLAGIQHAGLSLHDLVKKVRNPLLNPSFIFKRLFEAQSIENPKSTLNLNHYLHPSLDPPAQWLEHSVLRLQNATETVLSRYGAQVMDKQVEIARLAECAALIYATFACVARSSRAYCIGLQHADFEMVISGSFAYDAMNEVKKMALELRDGPFTTNDQNHQKIARHLFKEKGYFPVHPLTRNF